jgi:CII-binding regulator of phage lambda lysogenization HflD
MKATPEGCELRDELKETKAAVASLDTRLTKVESDVGKMRSETQEGIRALTASVANLAHDFGSRMNSMDARLVEEKVKWGDTLRKMLLWAVRVILVGALAAMGLTAYKTVFGN